MTEPTVQDGRTARGERNRDAVVEAILDLIKAGEIMPSASEVAERAGVSLRSVYRHFDDLEQLHQAAVARQVERTAHLWGPVEPRSDGRADRIDAFAANRNRLFEAVAPLRLLAMRRAPHSPVLADQLARGARVHRGQVAELFEPELAVTRERHGAGAHRDLLDALDVASSFEVWHQLRHGLARSGRRTTDVVVRSLAGLLAVVPEPPA